MIENLMLIALGFFVATLFAAIAAQFVWRRAVTVTTRELAGVAQQADESERARELDLLIQRQQAEMAPLEAEIDRLRNEAEALAAARDAALQEQQSLRNENNDILNQNNDLRLEVDRLTGETARLGAELRDLTAEAEALRAEIESNASLAAERAGRLATLKQELAALEAVIGEAPRPAPAAMESRPPLLAEAAPESAEPAAPLAFNDEEAARTLAEVKATLERFDAMGEQGHASYPAGDEPGEDATAPEEIQVSDKTLLARIRALEAGVAN